VQGQKVKTKNLLDMKDINRDHPDTPIRDGDARPDQNVTGKDTKKAGSPLASQKKKMTKERGADVNSLEDFKEAREE
jgi:hypothetical protein